MRRVSYIPGLLNDDDIDWLLSVGERAEIEQRETPSKLVNRSTQCFRSSAKSCVWAWAARENDRRLRPIQE
jgi:hypothetical protein